MALAKYKVDLPEGVQGGWRIEKFEVNAEDSKLTAMAASQHGRGFVPPGVYTQLIEDPVTSWTYPMMSDTPDEIRDHIGFIHRAEGTVLIHGLGIGMCAMAVARKPEVRHVLVIEKSPDVIALVAAPLQAQYCGKKIEIHEADAFTWKPTQGKRWNFIWHDIWPTLCESNLDEMATLHRRFGRRCDWQGSWGKERLQKQRRRA